MKKHLNTDLACRFLSNATLLAVLLLFTLPLGLAAQSMVKVDRAKMQAQKQEKIRRENVRKQLAEQQKRARTNNAPRKKRRRRPSRPHYASYLNVNYSTNPTFYVSADGETITSPVNTDGNHVNVSVLSSWMHLNYVNTSNVSLRFDANPNHTERKDWFNVYCDSRQVRVNVVQAAKPINVRATVYNVSLVDDGSNLRVSATVSISGAGNLSCRLVWSFVDDKYQNIETRSTYSQYKFADSNGAYVAMDFTPSSDDIKEYTLTKWIPKNELKLKKRKTKIATKVSVFCFATNSYIPGSEVYSGYVKVKR